MVIVMIMMVSMFAALVQTVNPMMMFIPMAWSPNHFVVMVPIASTMGVIRSVPYFNFDFVRPESGRKNNARGGYRNEPQFCINCNHTN